MSESSPHLQITHAPGAACWDDRQWRWSLRDAGLLHKRQLTEAPLRILMLFYTLADGRGEADMPQRWIAEQLGYTRACVNRTLHDLEKRRLIECVGASNHTPQVNRYRLCLETLAEDPQAETRTGVIHGSPRDRQITGSVIRESRGCDREITQSSPERHPEKASSSSAQGLSGAGGERTLFDGDPPWDAAAAAFLVRFCGLDKQVAKGLVNQYRPTAADVRVIYVNALTWRWAFRRGQRQKPLNNLPGFVRQKIRERAFHADPLVTELRRQGRQRAERVQRRAKQAQEAQRRHAEQAAEAQRRCRAVEQYERLSLNQWKAYYDQLVAETPAVAQLSPSSPRIKDWIIDLIAEKMASGE